MGDLLKVLVETSLDTVFVWFGLALLTLAIIGNISGKVQLGKGGRIAAALVGPGLIAAGLWMHSSHGLKIISLAIARPGNVSGGPCPVNVNLQGVIDAIGSGAVIYSFEYSDGTATPAERIEFDKSDSKLVNATWQVREPAIDGWVRLKTLSPKQLLKSEKITIACQKALAQGKPQEALPPAVGPGGTTPPTLREFTEDSVEFVSVSPKQGTRLTRGQPVPFDVTLDYMLVSADSAVLSLGIAQLPEAQGGCRGGGGVLAEAALVKITRGRHRLNVPLTWSGDTGAATKGLVYGKGYLSFVPSFWADNKGAPGERLKFFGTYTDYCYPFGP